MKINIQLFGGRGASSGISANGKVYGTEFTTLYQNGNIKFIRYNDSTASKSPMETMTKGRVYATIDSDNEVKYVTYYNNKGKRIKQIDVTGRPHKINGKLVIPHTHKGYYHDEYGTKELSPREIKMVERVLKTWYNYTHGK